MDIHEEKKTLRKKVQDQVNQMAFWDLRKKSRKIIANLLLLPEVKEARVVGAFYPVNNEVNIYLLLKMQLASGVRLGLPVIRGLKGAIQWEMEFREVSDLDLLSSGTFGIPEPRDGPLLDPKEMDLLLIPGVAFDRQGRRLGRGCGYYDRFLPLTDTRALKIAPAFSDQVVATVPVEEHDLSVDLVVTEDAIIDCRRAGSG